MEEQSYTSTHPLGHNRACNGNTLPLYEVDNVRQEHVETALKYMILNFRRVLIVVSFILGKSPASVYYCMPTFRNSLSVPSWQCSTIALEDGTDREFRNVGIQ